MYRFLYKRLLSRIDAERAHELAVLAMKALVALPGAGALLTRALRPRDPRLRVNAFGIDFPSPLGLGAGVDSSAHWFKALGALGFGFVEVGTVTALPQDGNRRPRVFRLPSDKAILNMRGFPNVGAAAASQRLQRRRKDLIVGVNVGKSKLIPIERAGGDYCASVRALGRHASYLVLNVSSPNTPGLRTMQSVSRLAALIGDVRRELAQMGISPPLLVKLAPDLTDAEIDAIAELAITLKIDGLIAVNTTVDRGVLRAPHELPTGVQAGGISGAPLKPRALYVLRRLRARVGERVPLIAVGGVQSAEDVLERIRAGATLVQAHTAFVYGGPAWPHAINRQLSERLAQAGVNSIAELIGAEQA